MRNLENFVEIVANKKIKILIKNNVLETLCKNQNFSQKLKSCLKINLGEQSKILFKIQILPKIQIFVKNPNCCQKSKFLSKT